MDGDFENGVFFVSLGQFDVVGRQVDYSIMFLG